MLAISLSEEMRFINIIFNLFGNQDGFTFSLVHKKERQRTETSESSREDFYFFIKAQADLGKSRAVYLHFPSQGYCFASSILRKSNTFHR